MDTDKKKLLASIFETTIKPIFACDLYGTVNSWNPAATELLNYSEKEINGYHFLRLIHRELQPDILKSVNMVLNGERANAHETILISKLHKEIPVSLTISPVYLDEELIGISFSCWHL